MEKEDVSAPFMRCSIKAKEKPKARQNAKKGKNKDPPPADWAKGKGKQKTKFKAKQGQKGKGYTAEEASLTEPEANEGQWLEPTDISPYDTWKVDSSSWDGMRKLTGDNLKVITRTGRLLRTGSLHRAGLPLSCTEQTQI